MPCFCLKPCTHKRALYLSSVPSAWVFLLKTHLKESKSFRVNFAGIGYKYDAELDAFIEPVIDASYESWVLDTTEGIYKPPVDYPDDGESYQWDESITNWKVQPPE